MGARLRAFGAFWYDFVVGDDWRLAVGVVAGILMAWAVAAAVAAWWVLPAAVAVVLPVSLRRALRSRG